MDVRIVLMCSHSFLGMDWKLARGDAHSCAFHISSKESMSAIFCAAKYADWTQRDMGDKGACCVDADLA